MNKKAVIVGIADYGNLQPTLTAPENEAEEWKDLLVDTYQFAPANVRMLCSARATRLAIIERLEWLLAGASSGDQLVFVYSGHAARLRRRHPNGMVRDNMDEAIVAYPESGQDIEQCSIYDDDLVSLLLLSRLPPQVQITFVLDCCFAEGFGTRELDQAPVFVARSKVSVTKKERDIQFEPGANIPVDILHRADADPTKLSFRFGEARRLLDMNQEPVIIAAVPTLETLPVGDFDQRRRTIFGYHMIRNLRANPTQSYAALGRAVAVEMLAQQIPDAPVISGNSARFDQSFLN